MARAPLAGHRCAASARATDRRAAGRRTDASSLPADELPRHVAIIMDGNRRWARAAGPAGARGSRRRRRGHPRPAQARGPARRPGPDPVRVQPRELGPLGRRGRRAVRPARGGHPRARPPSCVAQGVRVRLLGRLDELPDGHPRPRSRRRCRRPRAATGCCSTSPSTTPAAPSSSTRSARLVASGDAARDRSTRHASARRCTRPACPTRTCVIRTGGEQRISNFLIWQSAYAEFYLCETLWPDFGPDAFDAALLEFARRQRRFGR